MYRAASLGFAGLALVLLGRVGETAACTCKDPTDAEALANAETVFVGAVSDLGLDYSRHERVTGFKVQRLFKGAVPATVRVTTALSEGACGYAFARDTTYLVFAHTFKGRLITGLCAGNRALSAGQNPPPAFGSGYPPASH
jgi:hypothetical protein